MKMDGMPIAQIAKFIKLTEEKIWLLETKAILNVIGMKWFLIFHLLKSLIFKLAFVYSLYIASI